MKRLVLLFAFLAAACGQASMDAPPPKSAPADHGVEAEAPDMANGFEDALALEIVTDFLYPEHDYVPVAGEMPVGLVLLSRDDTNRNGALCEAFTKELRTYAEASAADPDAEFLITYWLLAVEPTDTSDCHQLRTTYDFDRAADLKAQYGLEAATGPVFLAVDSDGNTVFLDLSEASVAATRDAVDNWLKLALDASTQPPVARLPEDGSDAPTPSRYNLASFTYNMRARLLTNTASASNAPTESVIGGRQFFAYNDPTTGYRIGSTIRF